MEKIDGQNPIQFQDTGTIQTKLEPTPSEQLLLMQQNNNFKQAEDFMTRNDVEYSTQSTFVQSELTSPRLNTADNRQNLLPERPATIVMNTQNAIFDGGPNSLFFTNQDFSSLNGSMLQDQSILRDNPGLIHINMPPQVSGNEFQRNPNQLLLQDSAKFAEDPNYQQMPVFTDLPASHVQIANQISYNQASQAMNMNAHMIPTENRMQPTSHAADIETINKVFCSLKKFMDEQAKQAAANTQVHQSMHNPFLDQPPATNQESNMIPNSSSGLEIFPDGIQTTNNHMKTENTYQASPVTTYSEVSAFVESKVKTAVQNAIKHHIEKIQECQNELQKTMSVLQEKMIEIGQQRNTIDTLKEQNAALTKKNEDLTTKLRDVQAFVADKVTEEDTTPSKPVEPIEKSPSTNTVNNIQPTFIPQQFSAIQYLDQQATQTQINMHAGLNLGMPMQSNIPPYGQFMDTLSYSPATNATMAQSTAGTNTNPAMMSNPNNPNAAMINNPTPTMMSNQSNPNPTMMANPNVQYMQQQRPQTTQQPTLPQTTTTDILPKNDYQNVNLKRQRSMEEPELKKDCVWNPEENKQLVEAVECFSSDWQKISARLIDKTPEQCIAQYAILAQWNLTKDSTTEKPMATYVPYNDQIPFGNPLYDVQSSNQQINQNASFQDPRFVSQPDQNTYQMNILPSSPAVVMPMQPQPMAKVQPPNLINNPVIPDEKNIPTKAEPTQKRQKVEEEAQSESKSVEWLPEENSLLSEVAEICSNDWVKVAARFPNKTPEQCMSQWHVVQPRTGKWSAEEDQKLIEIHDKLSAEASLHTDTTPGGKLKNPIWVKIAGHIVGRSGRQCMARYTETLDPSIKKGKWSAEEDLLLKNALTIHGKSWVKLASCIPGRTQRQCRTRFFQMTRVMTPEEIESWLPAPDQKKDSERNAAEDELSEEDYDDPMWE